MDRSGFGGFGVKPYYGGLTVFIVELSRSVAGILSTLKLEVVALSADLAGASALLTLGEGWSVVSVGTLD